jgi:hypothetical protein
MGMPMPRPIPRPIVRVGFLVWEEVVEDVEEEVRTVPAGMVSQEMGWEQQLAGSGPQQNLTVLVVLSKLEGQGTRGISAEFWSGGGQSAISLIVR